jgi:hypothetical protein
MLIYVGFAQRCNASLDDTCHGCARSSMHNPRSFDRYHACGRQAPGEEVVRPSAHGLALTSVRFFSSRPRASSRHWGAGHSSQEFSTRTRELEACPYALPICERNRDGPGEQLATARPPIEPDVAHQRNRRAGGPAEALGMPQAVSNRCRWTLGALAGSDPRG